MAKMTKYQIEYTLKKARRTLRDKLNALAPKAAPADLSNEEKLAQISKGLTFCVPLFLAAVKRERGSHYGVTLLECFEYRRPAPMVVALRKHAIQKERHSQANSKVNALIQELEDKLTLGGSEEATAALAAIEAVEL